MKDSTLERLSDNEVKNLFDFIDPPRNFSVKWRLEQREQSLDGWVFIGLGLLPGVPLWFIWDQFPEWVGQNGQFVAGIVFMLQVGLIALFREPLTTAFVRLAVKFDRRHTKKQANSKTQQSPPPKLSEGRFQEMVLLGNQMAEADAMHNLKERVKAHQTTYATKQMAAQKYAATSDGMAQKQSTKDQAKIHLKEAASIYRRVDDDETPMSKAAKSVAKRLKGHVAKTQAQANATRTMEAGEKDRTQERKDNFQVFVDDNFNFMDEDERYRQGD